MEEKINLYNNRIRRNKTKIRHHKIYILMAIAVSLFASIFYSSNLSSNPFFFLVLFLALVGSDILFIFYHKWWIKKWRIELTKLTGRDYIKLDIIENEYISEKDFEVFADKFMKNSDYVLLNMISNNNDISIINKIYLFCLDAVLRSYCESRGILNSVKIKNLPYISTFIKKRLDNIK